MPADEREGRFPTAAVVAWLEARGVQLAGPVRSELISGGRSNLTYQLTDAEGQRLIVRRPPFDRVLATAHDMSREWRFISAVQPTPVPVPDPIALSPTPDGSPMGVPFYVMSYVDGLIFHDAAAASVVEPPVRAASAQSLVDNMALLHQVDIDAVGLGDIAKREDHMARQLRRWKIQWDQSTSTEITAVDELHDRLVDRIPPQQRATIVHGDFRLGNMICAPTTGEIRAVLDWELATLGDPLIDFSWMLSSWAEPTSSTGLNRGSEAPSVLPGFPSRQWMIDRYATQSGLDLSDLPVYLAFSAWRGCCISAGVLARYESGAMGDDGFDFRGMREGFGVRAESALEWLDSTKG
jgi:aminoglycoside phosphotransferase (APT) family kinase protein